MDFLKENKNTILYTTILIIYAAVVFITGFHHEPWADEAQAWLLSRDYTYFDLITQKLKYDGHPFVWYFLLRTIILTKVAPSSSMYEYIFILPFFFSVIGVYLLLFKSKLPMIFKVMTPFTFYICYQYSVLARNHSLALPAMAVTAIIFKDRLKKPYLYAFLLLLLANISAYTFVISAMLLLFFLYDIFKSQKKFNIKNYIPPIIVSIGLLLTVLYINRPDDCTFIAKLDISKFSILDIFNILHRCYFNYKNFYSYIIELIAVISFYILLGKTFCKNKYQLCFFIALNTPLLVIINILYGNDWHLGYVILTLIMVIWILTEQNNFTEFKFNKNKLLYAFIIIIFSTQIFWTIKCCIFDFNNNYCASKQVARYIKEKNLDKDEIKGLGFKTVAIQPYFEKNIFLNYVGESNWGWSKTFSKKYNEKNTEKPKTIIISAWLFNVSNPDIESLKLKYDVKMFNAELCSRGKIKESNTFVILEKKL